MKRISLALGLCLVVSIFAAGSCFAGEAATATGKEQKTLEQKPGKKAVKNTGTYVGEVVEIDRKVNKIIVAPKNSEIAMVLNTSKVKRGLDDIKVGDWVEATFEANTGTLYALTVSKGKTPEEPKKKSLPKQKPANHP